MSLPASPLASQAATAEPDPSAILQLGLGFWGSRTLLTAVEFGLFTLLAKGPLPYDELRKLLGLHERSARDFFDALVALGVLERSGDVYHNTREAGLFLDRAKPSYLGGILEMAGTRLYGFWNSLPEALRTGQLQNEGKTGGNFFASLYADKSRLRGFLQAMTGLSMGTARAIAQKFPWKDYQSFVDIGTAQGGTPVQLALAHPHLKGTGFDLPVVAPVFEDYVASFGLSHRIRFQAGDFFAEPWPNVDVIVMGHILHDWSLEEKQILIAKAHGSLPPGGACIVFDAVIDDDRRWNVFGLLMSLNMLIETPNGFDYTGQDCMQWMRGAGFSSTRVEYLSGPDSMVVGIK